MGHEASPRELDAALLTVVGFTGISPGMTNQSKSSVGGEGSRLREPFTLSDLDFDLPERLIAQAPPANREDARLLVVDRSADGFSTARADRGVSDLPELLRSGDLLVLNDTRVIPAKLSLVRKTGGRVRGLFLEAVEPGRWRVMLEGSRRLRVGERLIPANENADGISIELVESIGMGHWWVSVDPVRPAEETLAKIGTTPLPPYIKRAGVDRGADADDQQRYQTVYAKNAGAVAAPTAGLHFTDAMLEEIRTRGVEIAFVTLHVGLGTFKPIDVDVLHDHTMHSERYEISEATAHAINACKARSGRVIAVGTTSVRVLETAAQQADGEKQIQPTRGSTDIFIYPPYRYRVVDALLTNFHLPRSTLLALVMAIGGVDRVRQAYRHAVASEYRFFSYGDAMLIL